MIDLGMTRAERKAFEDALTGSHQIRIRIDILDRDEQVVGRMTDNVVEGSIQVDATADVTRTADITFADPSGKLAFAPDSAADAGVYADNFLAVRYGVAVGGSWVDVPVFWGPITSAQRSGPTVRITADGKERLALAPAVAWNPIQVPKGTLAHDAIRRIMQSKGERRFLLGTTKYRIPRPLSLGYASEPWKVARSIAAGANRQLFYDGAGRLRLRSWPGQPLFRFRAGAGGTVLGSPDVTYDVGNVRNTVYVLGPIRKGKARLKAVAKADNAHPLSAARLSRNGVPRVLVEVIELDKAPTQAVVTNYAKRTLADRLRAEVSVSFESAPVPHVEPGDVIGLDTADLSVAFAINRYTIPLTSGDTMAVNFLKRVAVRR